MGSAAVGAVVAVFIAVTVVLVATKKSKGSDVQGD